MVWVYLIYSNGAERLFVELLVVWFVAMTAVSARVISSPFNGPIEIDFCNSLYSSTDIRSTARYQL